MRDRTRTAITASIVLAAAVAVSVALVAAPGAGTVSGEQADLDRAGVDRAGVDKADVGPGDATVSTEGSWSPGEFFDVTVTYRVDASIDPTAGSPGERVPWAVTLENGEMVLDGSASLGSVDAEFSETVDVPLGSTTSVPVPNTGGTIELLVGVEAEVRNLGGTVGPARTGTASLDFDEEGTREFQVTVSENASPGDTIAVSDVQVVPTIQLGLREDVPLVGPGELGRREVPTRPFSPELGASTEVPGAGSGLPVAPLAVAAGLLALGGGYYLYKRR